MKPQSSSSLLHRATDGFGTVVMIASLSRSRPSSLSRTHGGQVFFWKVNEVAQGQGYGKGGGDAMAM